MRRKLLPKRRPSAAMLVALTALFVSMGGVGYAASTLPNNSVGTAQLQHSSVVHSKLRFNSVSFQDIQQRAIGLKRADLNQLQQRVASTCGAGNAIGAIANNGTVTCNAARPAEFGATGTKAVTALTSVVTEALPAGSTYLAMANPSATGPGGSDVTCTLTLGANKQSATVRLPATGGTSSESIPLQVAGPAGTADVSCSSTGSSSVTSAINAIATSANN
ncbi:MAG TPA: hypothetical protein VGG87_05760 [Solirubrobacteraceae bacterium]